MTHKAPTGKTLVGLATQKDKWWKSTDGGWNEFLVNHGMPDAHEPLESKWTFHSSSASCHCGQKGT